MASAIAGWPVSRVEYAAWQSRLQAAIDAEIYCDHEQANITEELQDYWDFQTIRAHYREENWQRYLYDSESEDSTY